MKINKFLSAVSAIALITAGTAFAEETNNTGFSDEKAEAISNGMNDFATAICVSVPEAATQQNVWTDSYIGTIFPGFKFGFGFSIGGTQLDMTGLKSAATSLCGDISIVSTDALHEANSSIPSYTISISNIPDTFILPSASFDLRIGGIQLPFDIGISAMATSPTFEAVDYSNPESLTTVNNVIDWNLGGFSGAVNYMAWGLDARYCLYEGDLTLPKISVGGGFYSINGSFAVATSDTEDLTQYSTALGTLVTDVNMGVSYNTKVAFAQVQANKDFGAVNIFGGLRGIVSSSSADWSWKYSSSNEESGATTPVKTEGYDSGTVATGDGIKAVTAGGDGTWDFSGVQPQIYLGANGSFSVIKTAFSLCADIRSFCDAVNTQDITSFIWSGAFSCHLQF